jgi:AraC-like DNA-binding protein
MFAFTSINPKPELKPFIERYAVLEVNSMLDIVQNLVPSNLQNIGFLLRGRMHSDSFDRNEEVSRSYVLGQLATPVRAVYSGNIRILALHFHPYGMYRLFGIPMNKFTNQGIDFESILDADERSIIERMFACTLLKDQIDQIEILLQKRLSKNRDTGVTRIQFASNQILQTDGNVTVKELLGQVNMSERSFERNFLQQVGVLPKTFAGIARMKKAMQLIEKVPNLTWKDITYQLEYTDQAHFIREFKRFAGKTPTDYYRSRSDFEHFIYGG